MEDLRSIESAALARANNADSADEIARARAEILSKKGVLGQLLASLRELPAAERPKAGQQVNEVKSRIEAALEAAERRVKRREAEAALEAGRCDVTLPGRRLVRGAPHPIRVVEHDIIRCFESLGFSVAEGPLIEHDGYNFESLNFPEDHPARDMQDTFYVESAAGDLVLRTHTSPVQIRTMEKTKPPVRIIAPGTVYRSDSDITHSPMFHQVEGLAVDRDITMADLKGLLTEFCRMTFGPGKPVRFRPSYFPFTEPSAEVDIQCVLCGGSGCRVCKESGWLEILGAGMVDPSVFGFVGYDPEEVAGFAFGMGVERIAMLRHGISDIRLFFENDLRFLSQF